ncbi:MAG TPA: DUF3592 domain-containing protein [Natronosporangium sp.]
MDLSSRVGGYAALAVLALSAVGLVRGVLRNLRERRDQRRLDQTGLTTIGQVVRVEPMSREENGAAGHPVQVAFSDQAGQERQFRDASGLGGYVVRAGNQVTVRYSPTDPELVRVTELHGPGGRYQPEPDRRTPPVVPGVLALAAVVLAGIAVAGYQLDLIDLPSWQSPPADELVPAGFGLIGLGILTVIGGLAIRRLATRRPRAPAVGVVTDVWPERVNTGRGSSVVHPITVHFATADGREVHARYRVAGNRRFAVHQRVRVRYDPAYPPDFDVLELRYAVWLLWLIPTLIGAVFLAIGGGWLLSQLG